MKKLLLSFLLVVSILSFAGCGSNSNGTTCPHMNFIEGKILEIKDSNTILLEITKEREGYKIEDKVLINYEEFVLVDLKDPDGNQTIITPTINDVVATQFWPDDVKQKDGYDFISVRQVEKYINFFVDSSDSSK